MDTVNPGGVSPPPETAPTAPFDPLDPKARAAVEWNRAHTSEIYADGLELCYAIECIKECSPEQTHAVTLAGAFHNKAAAQWQELEQTRAELARAKELLSRSLRQTRKAIEERDIAVDAAHFALDHALALKKQQPPSTLKSASSSPPPGEES